MVLAKIRICSFLTLSAPDFGYTFVQLPISTSLQQYTRPIPNLYVMYETPAMQRLTQNNYTVISYSQSHLFHELYKNPQKDNEELDASLCSPLVMPVHH